MKNSSQERRLNKIAWRGRSNALSFFHSNGEEPEVLIAEMNRQFQLTETILKKMEMAHELDVATSEPLYI